jgi:hypothetical protein
MLVNPATTSWDELVGPAGGVSPATLARLKNMMGLADAPAAARIPALRDAGSLAAELGLK